MVLINANLYESFIQRKLEHFFLFRGEQYVIFHSIILSIFAVRYIKYLNVMQALPVWFQLQGNKTKF